jgi:ABC-type xylose transport system substrate-binding protein
MIRVSKIVTVVLCLAALSTLCSFHPDEKIKIGFLVHDLVTERWRTEMENFSRKVIELGGDPVRQVPPSSPMTG